MAFNLNVVTMNLNDTFDIHSRFTQSRDRQRGDRISLPPISNILMAPAPSMQLPRSPSPYMFSSKTSSQGIHRPTPITTSVAATSGTNTGTSTPTSLSVGANNLNNYGYNEYVPQEYNRRLPQPNIAIGSPSNCTSPVAGVPIQPLVLPQISPMSSTQAINPNIHGDNFNNPNNTTTYNDNSTIHIRESTLNSEMKTFRRKTRNNLPKQTTYILLKWLNEHLNNPYPNSYEKKQLMVSTGLNQQQLSNWFINARRRKIKFLKDQQKRTK